jgi:hypothetical protein
MKRRATSEYIWLGTALRYCADAKEGYLIGGDGGVAFNLRRFLEELDNLRSPSLNVRRLGGPNFEQCLSRSRRLMTTPF